MLAKDRESTPAQSTQQTPRHPLIDRQWRADLLEILAWVSIAMAVATFLSANGTDGWSTPEATVTSMAQLAGLIAADLLVLQLLLAARVPFIDRAIGHDRALGHHRDLTVWAMSLVGVHMILMIVSWAIAGQTTLFAATAVLWNTEDIAIAFLGVALLCAVGASSFAAVKARLPHEAWHAIHLATYAAIALAVPHMFSASPLLAAGWPRVYWFALFAAAAFCLLTFRWLYPLFMSLDHRFVVTEVKQVSPDGYEITVRGRNVAQFPVEPGQFCGLRFLLPTLCWHAHPFSVSAAPDGASLRFTMRVLGRGTAAIARDLRPGTRVIVAGPYGVFTPESRMSPDVVLAGAGVGIAPIRALAQALDAADGVQARSKWEAGDSRAVRRVAVILRASTSAELVHAEEIRQLCAVKHFQFIPIVGPRFQAAGGGPRGAGRGGAGAVGVGMNNVGMAGARLSCPNPGSAGLSCPNPGGAGLSCPNPGGAGVSVLTPGSAESMGYEMPSHLREPNYANAEPLAYSWTSQAMPVRLNQLVPWVNTADVFACGPQPWADAFVADAVSAGVPAHQIHNERFSW